MAVTKTHGLKISPAAAAVAALILAIALASRLARADDNHWTPISADRPSRSAGPLTVGEGHAQFETDVINYTRDVSEGDITETFNLGHVTARVGVTADGEIQALIPVHRTVTVKTAGLRTRVQGYSDMALRYKWNLFGNDGSRYAMALLPSVRVPTAATGIGHDDYNASLIVPWSADLGSGFNLGLHEEVISIREQRADLGFASGAVLGKSLTPRLATYLEVFSEARGTPAWATTIGAGLTDQISRDVQIDLGFNRAADDNAADLNVWLGFSYRVPEEK
jgi:hypothetical protein